MGNGETGDGRREPKSFCFTSPFKKGDGGGFAFALYELETWERVCGDMGNT